MEIILKKDLISLGEEGDIKNVKPGYARNYLFPRGIAVIASPSNKRILQVEQKAIAKRKEKKMESAKEASGKIAGIELSFIAKAGEGDKLYGSITHADIAKKLTEAGHPVDKRKIEIAAPIRTAGTFDVKVRLYEGVEAMIKVHVTREETKEEIEAKKMEEKKAAEKAAKAEAEKAAAEKKEEVKAE